MQTRKQLLRIACASAGITFDEFATSRGVNQSTLSNVLKGRDKSARLLEEVDAFIDEQLSELRIRLNSWDRAIYPDTHNIYANGQ